MKIHEFQAKELFKQYSIPVPNGVVAESGTEAQKAAESLAKGKLAVKAQIHAGGRGKGGGSHLLILNDMHPSTGKDPVTGEQEEPHPLDLYYSFSQDKGETFVEVAWDVNPDSSGNFAGETVYRWDFLAKGDPEQGEAQLRAEQIDLVAASASGYPPADRREAAAIEAVFGSWNGKRAVDYRNAAVLAFIQSARNGEVLQALELRACAD